MDDYRNTIGDGSLPLGSIAPGNNSSGIIDVGNDVDLFAITLTAGTTYSFDLNAPAGGTLKDYSLSLMNSLGTSITSASAFSNATAHILFTATTGGTYYLGSSSIFSQTGTYTLSASKGFVDDFGDTFNDTLQAPGALTAGASIGGLLESDGDLDVFGIDLVAGTTYSFDLSPQAGGTLKNNELTLRDASGVSIRSVSAFSSSGATAHILYTATTSGKFYLEASGAFSNDVGAYTLSGSNGFVDDYRDTFNDTLEALGTISSGGAKNGSFEAEDDTDVFAIQLTAGQTYTFDLKALGNGTLDDTTLTVRDAAGVSLDSESGFGSPANFLYTATTTGIHYLSAEAAFSAQIGDYTLSVDGGFIDDFRDTYNDKNEALGAVAVGGSSIGVIETEGDDDIFAVTLSAGQTYTFSLAGTAGGTLKNTSLTVLDSAGSSKGSTSGFAGDPSKFVFTASTTGTHYLEATGILGDLGGYTVSVSNGFVDDYRDVYNDSSETLGVLNPGTSKTGSIEIGGDRDIFAIALTAGLSYTFDLKGQPGAGGTLGDASLALQNAMGGTLANGTSLGGTADDRIVYTATATGTYYLNSGASLSTATGTYTLNASAGTPADDYRNVYNDGSKVLGSLSPGGTKTGFVEAAGDRDIFAISLISGQSYTFSLKGQPGGGGTLGDVSLALQNATGATLASGTSLGGTTDDRIIYTATTTGTHYLAASGAINTATGTYTLSASTGTAIDDYRDSIGDTTAPFGVVASTGTKTGSIEAAGDRDFFSVTLIYGQSYTFDLTGIANGGTTLSNPELRLLNSGGTVLVTNNDFNGLNSRIVYTATGSGTYYLDAHSWVAGGTGNYQLSAKQSFDDYRDSIADTTAPFGPMSVNSGRNGSIETAGDRDFYAITLIYGQTYTFDLQSSTNGGASLFNSELRLLNSAGAVLFTNNDFNGFNSRITYTATNSGTYYLDAHSATSSGVGNYRIGSVLNFDDYRDSISDATTSFGSVAVNGSWLGSIEIGGDRDFYTITLTAGQSYTFTLSGSATGGLALFNAELTLLNGSGGILLTNNDFNGFSSQIVYTAISSGTYYLNAHSATSTGTGSYIIGTKLNFDDYRDTIADTTAPFGALTANSSRFGSIETAGDRDVFGISLTAGHSYTFDLTGSTNGGAGLNDPELRLLNSAGAVLLTNDDYIGLNSRIVFTATSSGTYYLDARSHTASGTGNYLIGAKLNFDDFRDSITDSTTPFGSVTVNATTRGAIETPGDSDFFSVTVQAGRAYRIDLDGDTASGNLANGDIQLLNSGGTMIDYNDDANGTFDSQLIITAGYSGVHYLNVGGVGVNQGVYALSLTEIV